MKKVSLLILGLLGLQILSGQTILLETFNSGLPAGWTVVDGGDGTDTWNATSGGARGGNYLDGTEFMFVDSDAAPQTDTLSELLISPAFNTTTYSDLILEFDHHHRVWGGEIAWVEVYNGNSWVVLDSFPGSVGGFNNPDHESYNVTAYSNANFQIRFRYEDNGVWGWYWGVDNVELFSPQPLDAEIVSFTNPTSGCSLGSEQVQIAVLNAGSDTIQGLNMVYVINAGTPVSEAYNTPIAPGSTVNYTFSTLANISTPGSYTFDAYVDLNNDANNLNDTISGITVNHYLQVNSFPYSEDFEQGQGGWESYGANNTWAFGTPVKDVIIGAASGSNAWVTGGLSTGDYNNNEQSWIQSPCLDLSNLSNPWIQFSIWWNIEWSYDGAALQSSTDLGATWQTVGAFGDPNNWYTDNTIDGAPGGSSDGWTGRNSSNDGSGTWVPASHDLGAVAGEPSVILRIIFGTDGSVTDDGLAIDDILVAEGPTINLGPDTTACDSFVLNPGGPFAEYLWSTGDTTQTVTALQSGTYEVTVTDSNGFITTDDVALVVFTLNDLELGPDIASCEGNPVTLDAGSSGNSYLWSTGATSNTINVSSSGNYFVTVSYGNGCLKNDQVDVFIANLETGYILSDTQLCRNVPATFTDTTSDATGWFWDFGDGTTATTQAVTHTYTSGGTFALKLVTSAGACQDSVVNFLSVAACGTGIEEEMGEAIGISPNPNSGEFVIHWEGIPGGELSLRVMDARGVLIRKEIVPGVHSGEFKMDLGGVAKGLYLVEIRNESGTWIEKMWVE